MNNSRCYEVTFANMYCEYLIERDLHDGHDAMLSLIALGVRRNSCFLYYITPLCTLVYDEKPLFNQR